MPFLLPLLPRLTRGLHTSRARLLSSATATATATANPRPHVIAIVGAGPAGFYSAHRLLKDHPDIHIHLYDRLPAPYGLVRYGVAPDHPDVKNVIHQFDKVAESPRFAYFGNVPVGDLTGGGRAIPLADLQRRYSAVILASGATAADNAFGVPGEDTLANIHSARAFVGWYNGLPEFAHLPVDLTAGDTALVFGQGNVALDVARILLSPPDTLRGTDIAPHALAHLRESKIKHVRVIGRRGPLQVAFTAKELRELLSLAPRVQFLMDHALLQAEMAAHGASLDRARKRLMGILDKTASAPVGESAEIAASWSLDFLQSPQRFLPNPHSPSAVGAAVVAHNALRVSADGRVSATPTGAEGTVRASLVVKSIGYRAAPLDATLPFDAHRNVVRHDGGGKVTDTLYVAGWLKRGPTGVIASTMRDAYETAEVVLRTMPKWEHRPVEEDAARVKAWIEHEYGHRVVDWAAWQRVKQYETLELGGGKVVSVDDMLKIALP